MITVYTFWALLLIIIYCYLGYTLLLLVIVGIRKVAGASKQKWANSGSELPEITLVIAAYNERDIVDEKIANTLAVNYPKNKLKQIWVTDGSNDGTPELLKKYLTVNVIHTPERQGKAAAINHAMEYVDTPITVFSDANTMLTPNALLELIEPFGHPKVGCVAGEKQIDLSGISGASSTGEGIYWKYESFIKQLESESGSTLSAAGELFAIRTELFQKLRVDTILDDFEISTQIALKGYAVVYAGKAIAIEKGSLNFDEERKRKIRIAAGGYQTLLRCSKLLNPFASPILTFKYISHKVLRWTIVPFAILLLPLINLLIIANKPTAFYKLTFIIFLLFYMLAFCGHRLKNNRIKFHTLFLPYFLIMMNIAEIQGLVRYILKKQDAKWEKAKREKR